jgi:putative addiction module CopG family antidote
MNLNLAPVDEAYLKGKVEEGYYVNMAEAIRDAIRRMRETDEQGSRELYEAIMVGERQIASGQYKPYTPELLEQIQRNAARKAAEGTPLKPDATGL